MDVRFATPYYRSGKIWCWLSNTGHWPDTGGMVPGGFSASAIAVEQEGLRLPPVKLFKNGVLDPEIYAIITSNIRVADARIGDVKAQASALLVGAERLTALLDRYGDATVAAAIAEIRARAAAQMRAMIAAIPEGTYAARAFVDSDGVVDEPLTIALTVTRAGDGLTFDFAGSSPPCAGPMNSVRATTLSSVYLAMRHIFPEVPISAGAFEPLTVTGIEGTFLDARYPRPVSGCAAEVSQRIAEAVFAALVAALPDRVTAAPAGTSGNFALGGHDPERGRDYVMYQISGGGYGGNADHDGLSNGCSTIGISKAPAGRDHGAAIPGALPPLRPARRLRRRRHPPRRLRPRLRGRAPARHRPRELRHGPRPLRPAGRARRRRRRRQPRRGDPRRRDPDPASTSPRPRTSPSPPATASASAPPAAAATAPRTRDRAAVAEDVRLGRYTAEEARRCSACDDGRAVHARRRSTPSPLRVAMRSGRPDVAAGPARPTRSRRRGRTRPDRRCSARRRADPAPQQSRGAAAAFVKPCRRFARRTGEPCRSRPASTT